MRLQTFSIKNRKPIEFIELNDLSNVVVLAGPNGVGKTRLVQSLIELFKAPKPNPELRLVVSATSQAEKNEWGKPQLDTSVPEEAQKIRTTIHRNQRRQKYKSSVLYFESNRSIANIAALTFSWDLTDPDLDDVAWGTSLDPLTSRFQDVQHSLFRKVEAQRRAMANRAFDMQRAGHKTMDLDFADPLEAFKTAFGQLLGPKKMLDADLKNQLLKFESEGTPLNFDNLSSGEREVVNIVFDFLLRNPSDCITIFDEPELHLHPELSYRLLQTLTSIGKDNQFIFCTHSPDIISASLENSVYFVTPPKHNGSNQAIVVDRNDETHEALQMMGQSIGVVSLGRQLVLIEGKDSSLDKQAYGAILRNQFPEFVLVPAGGHGAIRARTHNQYAMMAAMWRAARKVSARLSYLVAIRRKSFMRQNMRSMAFRPL